MSLAVTSRETPQKNRYLLRPPGGYHLVASTCLTKRIAPSLGRPCPPRPRTTDGPRKLPNARTGARNPKLPRIRPKARATRTREPARGTRSSPSAPEGTRSGRQAGVSDTARAVTETGRSCSTGRPNRAKARPWGGGWKLWRASAGGRSLDLPTGWDNLAIDSWKERRSCMDAFAYLYGDYYGALFSCTGTDEC